MSTQISIAKEGKISDELYSISRTEKVDIEFLRYNIAKGKIAVLKNNTRNISRPVAVGSGLRTKIAADIGICDKKNSAEDETDRIMVAKEAGADILLDNTTSGYFDETRKIFLNASLLPFGSIPIFQTTYKNEHEFNIANITKDNIFSTIEKHLNDGVDFICLNCGLTKTVLKYFKDEKPLTNLPSRNGILTACSLEETGIENPLYEYFDELIELIKRYDAVLYLSQGLRSSSICNSYSRAAVMEANISAELATRAKRADVQTIIESGGHIRYDKITSIIKTIKELAENTPVASRDIIPTDITLGYEAITTAIGYTNAVLAGSNILFATKNSLGKYNSSTLKDGIISAKIAAHCADTANEITSQLKRNESINTALKNKDTILYRESLIDGYSHNNAILDALNNKKSEQDNCFYELFKAYFL